LIFKNTQNTFVPFGGNIVNMKLPWSWDFKVIHSL
jgi:hypothetical protein